MENSNLIATLFPADGVGGFAWKVICMSENASRYIPPEGETNPDSSKVGSMRSRESTVSLEDEEAIIPKDEEAIISKDEEAIISKDEEAIISKNTYPGLQLTFNPKPKAGPGLVLGTGRDCDIVLPQLHHISRRHCYLTFDSQRRLILRDFSSFGTVVSYDGQGEGRRNFTWILGGHLLTHNTERIVIEIHGIKFQIIVSTHDQNPDLYNDNVDQFRLGALGFQSGSSTTALSGATTPPPQFPIRLEQEKLGTGAFAVVKRVWDVSTGIEYARKEPLNEKKFDREMWEKEANIMSQISHDYVVKLIDMRLNPWPQLTLEYIPHGNLKDLRNITDKECLTILCQALSALVDLHGRQEPIVHRDIKPGNMLVYSRDPLHIKLADFGLSRASKDLTTWCGTSLYLAPEVDTHEYTPVVDIWSLGVVVYEFAYGLPECDKYSGRRWCKRIVEKVNGQHSEGLIDLLSTAMLVMDPTKRRSAQYCYQEALRLPVPSQGRCRTRTPTPASSAEECDAPTVIYHPAEEQESGDQSNQSFSSSSYHTNEALSPESTCRSSQHEGTVRADENQKHASSGAPPPESYTSRKRSTRSTLSTQATLSKLSTRVTRSARSKRSARSSTPSSSGRRHTKRTSIPSQRAVSEPVLDLFGQNWLLDPNCVGSSVAAMGEEDPSDISGWEPWTREPSVGNVPRSLPGPVDVQSLIQDGVTLAQDFSVFDPAAQSWEAAVLKLGGSSS